MLYVSDNLKSHAINCKIDYVSVVLDLSPSDEYHVLSRMKELKDNIDSEWFGGKEHYKSGLIVKSVEKGWWVKIQCCPISSKSNSMKLSFNYIDGASAKDLVNSIDMWFKWGWDRFLYEGRITRADFAVDMLGLRPNDFLWAVSHSYKKYQSFYNDESGLLETAYIGSCKSEKYVVIYDKSIANVSNANDSTLIKGVDSTIKRTRIEARWMPKSVCFLKDISELLSIFGSIHVARVKTNIGCVNEGVALIMSSGCQRLLLKNSSVVEGFLPKNWVDRISKSLMKYTLDYKCVGLKEEIENFSILVD